MEIQKAIPGGKYACSCGNTFNAPMDAVACCSNQPGLMVPTSAPVDEMDTKGEDAVGEVIEDFENQESR